MLTEHDALHHLRPFWAAYQNMLQEVEAGGRFQAGAQESYTAKVFERLNELEHDLSNLKLATQFIGDLAPDLVTSPLIYRYHDEYFSIRLAAMLDRAHRLAGAALLLKADKCEGSGGAAFVIRAAKDHYPEVAANLERLAALETNHKKLRQKLRLESDATRDGLALADDFYRVDAQELKALIARVEPLLAALLQALQPVFALI